MSQKTRQHFRASVGCVLSFRFASWGQVAPSPLALSGVPHYLRSVLYAPLRQHIVHSQVTSKWYKYSPGSAGMLPCVVFFSIHLSLIWDPNSLDQFKKFLEGVDFL